MDAALLELRSDSSLKVAEVARRYNVSRPALGRRFNLKSTSIVEKQESQRLLNNQQEMEILKYIRRLSEHYLPPTACVIRNMASKLCGSMPSKIGFRFIARHEHELGREFFDSIDLSRCKSESKISFANYFLRISQKIEQLNITAENIYNMNEKGFLIGKI
ncbi:hypothetical protein K3495_g10205 [Podosphaera aphanis]|nr:hypothetical protein K3495_g10205 [Podosphaera aphanis]